VRAKEKKKKKMIFCGGRNEKRGQQWTDDGKHTTIVSTSDETNEFLAHKTTHRCSQTSA
jgi:hypothetical protein